MQNDLINKIVNFENLLWAWNKAKSAYHIGDIWFDMLELSQFEGDLHNRLIAIQQDVLNDTYELKPIKPLPFPKGQNEDGNPRARQTFYISVRDQVIWLAVVNVIGAELDYQMPFWSYGNRLYYSVWFEEGKNGKKEMKTGWYRNSTRVIYRTWKQSWPLFRHHITMTIKGMVDSNDYNDQEKENLENNEKQSNNFKVKYIERHYWGNRKTQKLYWAGMDFEKFYPNLKIEVVRKNILLYYSKAKKDSKFEKLINTITAFKLDFGNEWSEEELKFLNIFDNDKDVFGGLPTGLFVAGFLANVGLLEVDKAISEELATNKNIAHFRFVDDHIIIGYDFEEVLSWVEGYKKVLTEMETGAKVNLKKIDPDSLKSYLTEKSNPDSTEEKLNDLKCLAKKGCFIDPAFPSPLMTQTLAKVSNIADCDIDFLTDNEEKQLISDLEHLLITDFPEHELRHDTRISFAASMLARIVPKRRIDYSEIYELRKQMSQKLKSMDKICPEDESISKYKNYLEEKYLFESPDVVEESRNIINEHKIKVFSKAEEILLLSKEIKTKYDLIHTESEKFKQHTFRLLFKAVKENHEKVKLWGRIIDYCISTRLNNYEQIFDGINEIYEQKKSSELSTAYLYSLFLQVISERLLSATYHLIYSQNDSSLLQTEDANFLIKSIFSDKLLDNIFDKEKFCPKTYYKKSFIHFRLTLGTTAFVTKDSTINNTIKKHHLICWEDNPDQWCEDNNIEINNCLYYLIYRINRKTDCHESEAWKQFEQYIRIDSSSIPYNLILPFPNSCSKNEKLINKLIRYNSINEGWLFDVYKENPDNIPQLEVFNAIRNNLNNIEEEKITLFNWIKWSDSNSLNNIYDPRLSEWMAIKIIIRIIEIHMNASNFLNSIKLDKIHPSNYFMPKLWLKDGVKSWEFWKNENFNSIEIRKDSAQLIKDDRYTPLGLKNAYNHINDEVSAIHGFAILLLQVISHNTSFPWIWNITDKNIEYSKYIYSNVTNITISSMTRTIISSCILSRSRESIYWKNPDILSFSDDTMYDPPPITNLSDMKKYLLTAQKMLESYQLSVGENMPRQLIPISLKQFSSKNNPFKES